MTEILINVVSLGVVVLGTTVLWYGWSVVSAMVRRAGERREARLVARDRAELAERRRQILGR